MQIAREDMELEEEEVEQAHSFMAKRLGFGAEGLGLTGR